MVPPAPMTSSSGCAAITRTLLPAIEPKPRPFTTSLRKTLRRRRRSEEHTSELQSRQYLVCRLLLENNNARRLGAGAVPGADQLQDHGVHVLHVHRAAAPDVAFSLLAGELVDAPLGRIRGDAVQVPV